MSASDSRAFSRNASSSSTCSGDANRPGFADANAANAASLANLRILITTLTSIPTWTASSNTPGRADAPRVRVTHPFHPLCGREFEFVRRKLNWGEDRVWFYDERGALCGLPAAWTDRGPVDPFVVVAAGRCAFGLCDLLELAEFVEARR